jgi:hypothetical protein
VTGTLLEADDPGHVVVLSTLYPGYAIPLLLSLRGAGVRELSVAYAPWYALDDFVAAMSDDSRVRRLSLINLDVSYSAVETWQPKLLQQVSSSARRRGWEVRILEPGEAAASGPQAVGGRRVLWIVTPVQTKYFSG